MCSWTKKKKKSEETVESGGGAVQISPRNSVPRTKRITHSPAALSQTLKCLLIMYLHTHTILLNFKARFTYRYTVRCGLGRHFVYALEFGTPS